MATLWLHYGAGGRPFVPVCGHYDETAALWLPYRGLEGGLLSRYLWIMTTNDDTWPPSGSISGLEGGLLSRYLAIMTTMAALWLPLRGLEGGLLSRICEHYADAWPPSGSHIGAGGRPFVPVSADYDDHGRPLAPITGAGGRPFVPEMRPLWRRPWRETFYGTISFSSASFFLTRHMYIKLEKKKNQIRASVFIFAAHQVRSHVPV